MIAWRSISRPNGSISTTISITTPEDQADFMNKLINDIKTRKRLEDIACQYDAKKHHLMVYGNYTFDMDGKPRFGSFSCKLDIFDESDFKLISLVRDTYETVNNDLLTEFRLSIGDDPTSNPDRTPGDILRDVLYMRRIIDSFGHLTFDKLTKSTPENSTQTR